MMTGIINLGIWEHKVSPAPLAKHIHVTGLARLD